MGNILGKQFEDLADKIVGYMPNLLAGVVLVLLGWFFGWMVKRIVIRMAVILKLERFFMRSRWGEDFNRGDIRYGFYNFLGNIAFIIFLLIFIDNALVVWKLNILSELVNKGILFLPRVIISLVIFWVGWLLASFSEQALLKTLRREDIPRSSLIAKFVKSVIILFFSAMGIVELDIAREIVIVGFSVIYITLGALTIIITSRAGKEFGRKLKYSLKEEKARKKEGPGKKR